MILAPSGVTPGNGETLGRAGAGAAVRREVVRRYALALGLVATVLIAGWWLLHVTIASGASDASVINTAGAQRMLSQRLSLLTLTLESDPADAAALELAAETHARMAAGHAQLIADPSAPARATAALRDHYFGDDSRLAARVEAFLDTVEAFLADPADDAARAAMAQARRDAVGPLLTALDRAVSLHEADAARQVARAETIHAALVVLGLVILALEALLIFNPMARRLSALTEAFATQNARLDAALAEAQRAEAATARFTATVSHEMRTPLNGVVGMLDLVAAGPLEIAQAHRVATALGAARHAVSLLDDILDAASLDAGAFELAPRPTALRSLLDDALSLFAGRAAEKGLALVLDVQPGTPAEVFVDPKRLKQIVMNLIGNAVKFTETGSVALRAGLTGTARLRVAVADTGPGMEAAAVARLFQRFAQVQDTADRTPGGTGLGLSISKDLVEAMGGRIGVESAPGAGSLFWFEIPVEAAVAETAPETEAAAAPAPTGLRVLVVDDSEVNRVVAGQMLEVLGHRVTLAADGVEAVDKVADKAFDIVFMDGEMPRMGGLDAARAILTDWPEHVGAIVGLTGHANPREHEACRAAGMAEVIVKPVTLADLKGAVERMARHRLG